MPIWGNRFRQRTEDTVDMPFPQSDAEVYVGTRILALIEYLSSLQAE
jgi:hypothetical protein